MPATTTTRPRGANEGARRSPSLPEALRAIGIGLKSHKDGQHRARCPDCDRGRQRPKDMPLAVRLDGTGATWLCFRCGWTGGLWRCLGCGGYSASRLCSPCQEARDERQDPRQPAERRPSPPPPPEPRPDPITERKRELALETWRQTEAIADGLPFAYLTRRRGISHWDCDRVRWHPACPAKLDEAGRVVRRAGCIVCPVTSPATGYVAAIWIIRPVMAGKVARWGLGPVGGSAARLFDAPGPELVIAEGVEDALAAHALFGVPAWAALSAGNMAKLILPERIRSVLVLADRDELKEDGRQIGLEAAHELARRLRAEGRGAEVRWSRIGKDPNDALRGTAA
jgi:hypothetical protein